MPSRTMLTTMLATVTTEGPSRVKPSLYLRPRAQPTSNKPATTRTNQATEPDMRASSKQDRDIPRPEEPNGADAVKRGRFHVKRTRLTVDIASDTRREPSPSEGERL